MIEQIDLQKSKKKKMKKAIMQSLNELKPPPNAGLEEAIECLVKQAEFYTNFLISRHDTSKKSNQEKQAKKRGHFDEDDSEQRQLMEEQQEEQNVFTRLTEQPSILKGGKLKHYQLVGLNWMISLYESGLSGILADDMGLGKTIQTISILGFLKEYKKIKGPHIIIAPKITLGNWKNQFDKWLPECNVVKLIATKEQRQQILAQSVIPQKFDVLVTSFEGVRICLNYLRKIKWHYVVIDQAHKIKNQDSQLSHIVRKLSNQCKLLLTGTPLQNNIHELWSLLNFLMPEIFDSSEIFDNWFTSISSSKVEQNEEQKQKEKIKMIGHLHKILKPFMLRRTKLEVQKSLPGKKQIHIFVGLTDTQLKVYKRLLENRSACEDEKKVYLNLLMQLKKVCNHPYLFEGIEEEGAPSLGQHIVQNSGKLKILDKLLKKLFDEGGHQVLIFSQMTMMLDILQDYCNFRKYKYCRIDGSTDMNSRDQQIQEFMEEGSQRFIFLLSTRAGGLGINLTSADTVVIYDSDWNPQMDLQAMDRAHRIGQKNMVNVYRLITENTVEEKIIQRQTIKLKWDNVVIQQAKTSSGKNNKALTKQEVKDWLQFGASIILKGGDKGTITDEDIDMILKRGEDKTNQMNEALQLQIKDKKQNLDFSMNSINIFDFMMNDDKRKKDDQQALDEAFARKLNQGDIQMRTRRQKNKNVNYTIDLNPKKDFLKAQRRINAPEYHFYENRDLLIQLMEKEQDYNLYKHANSAQEPLTQQQTKLKDSLLETGFRSWNKADFTSFISGSEKYGRDNLLQISKIIGKEIDEVKKYHQVFWSRIDQLSQKDRILKQIQTGEEKIANKKYNMQLLEWKAERCYQIEFNPQIYTKFKSKLFSLQADRFLAQCAYKYGLKNMSLIKDKIRTEPMFRFDHHFRSRTESQLNKRLQSLYKLLQKQKDHSQLGFDNEVFKETKKKTKKANKQEEKKEKNQNEAEVEAGSDDESDDDKGPRKRRNLNEIVIGSDDDPDYE